jgi:hypothetical protein
LGIGNGSSKIITEGNAVYQSIQSNDAGKMVALYSNPQTPEEVYVFDGLQPRRLTHVQDEFLSNLKLAHVKGFTSISADKTEVSGILYTPDSTAKKCRWFFSFMEDQLRRMIILSMNQGKYLPLLDLPLLQSITVAAVGEVLHFQEPFMLIGVIRK